MNRQTIQHITRSHYKKIKKQLQKIAADFDTEQVHQFRVTYKKLRAFLRLISFQNESHKLKISKKLNRCYHIAGLLRDLQFQQLHIREATKKNLAKSNPYLNLLRQEMTRVKTELSEIIATNPVAASELKTNKNIPRNFPSTKISQYAKEKWQAVYEMIAAAHFTELSLHTIRKNLKDLFYILKRHKATWHKALSKHISNKKQFNQLLDELGDFHDLCTGVKLLNSSWLKKLNRQQQQLLTQVKKEWAKEKAAFKYLVVKKLQAIFSIQTTAQ
jgi:CHAD domain-containing protein